MSKSLKYALIVCVMASGASSVFQHYAANKRIKALEQQNTQLTELHDGSGDGWKVSERAGAAQKVRRF